jgi:hypothetical protein
VAIGRRPAVFAGALLLGACNAILGVEDRVLRDGVVEAEAGPDGTSTLPDATIKPDGSPVVDGGTRDADAGEADADASINHCDGGHEIGEYATWFGKVNLHRAPGGVWLSDDDCTSGATVNTVAYCQKFWPTTLTQYSYPATVEPKPFASGGGAPPTCGGVDRFKGEIQYACCGP